MDYLTFLIKIYFSLNKRHDIVTEAPISLTKGGIIIFIVITCTTGWGSIPAGAIGCVAMRSIWSDEW